MSNVPSTTEQVILDRIKGDIDDYDDVVQSARQGMESEKALSLGESLRRYPRAVAWSVLLSTSLVMEGFDTVLINTLATKTTLTIPLRSKHLTKNCPASLQSPMWSMLQSVQSSRSLRKARFINF
ncbi:MFS transporter, SP family, general alpha glucoside:H+ symporter [Cryptococcus neoformans c8]|nr:MFS transporter, SP family, general alpha glucoside:H+ symporter [Cryptococcus neoformans var. grubii c8]